MLSSDKCYPSEHHSRATVCKHTRSASASLLPFPAWTPASRSTLGDRTSAGEVGDMHELRMGPQRVVNRDKPHVGMYANLRDPMLDGW